MAMGKPVIVADRGMLSEVVDHEVSGLVVKDTSDGLVQAVLRLLRHPELRESCGKAAYEKALSYSQERMVFGYPIGDYQLTQVKTNGGTLVANLFQYDALGRWADGYLDVGGVHVAVAQPGPVPGADFPSQGEQQLPTLRPRQARPSARWPGSSPSPRRRAPHSQCACRRTASWCSTYSARVPSPS
jgi:hypothetical protein